MTTATQHRFLCEGEQLEGGADRRCLRVCIGGLGKTVGELRTISADLGWTREAINGERVDLCPHCSSRFKAQQ